MTFFKDENTFNKKKSEITGVVVHGYDDKFFITVKLTLQKI